MLKEQWTPGVTVGTVNEYVQRFKERLTLAKELAGKHLKEAQRKMSEWYDKRAMPRVFQVGSQVMVLLLGKSRVTESRFEGPYQVLRRLGPVSYEIGKPDRPRKKQACHVDRLKPYFPVEGGAAVQDGTVTRDPQQKTILCMQVDQELPEEEGKWSRADGTRLINTESFSARRSCPNLMISVNGSNLAAYETCLSEIWDHPVVRTTLNERQCYWKFVPPQSNVAWSVE
ncbi:uncharacterized protein [Procambarus clarkii]|uniref:uncharacterized protein n=1 Tax=Procambarus clarkii TaxID=6728 RepID=UPI003742E791